MANQINKRKFIVMPNGLTPLNEKYFYTESQGIWFIITLLARNELTDRIMFEARIDDILWRQGRHGIGDTFTFGRSKSPYYGSWELNLLNDGLNQFVEDYGGKSSLQVENPDFNLDTNEGIIGLIKVLKRDKWNAKRNRNSQDVK